MAAWRADPSILLGLLLISALYLAAARNQRFAQEARLSRTKVALFLSGLVVLGLALESPLDGLGDRYLFSIHMAQHLLLVLVVPPLLLGGLNDALLQPFLQVRWVGWTMRVVTKPAVAFLTFNVVFAFAHLPSIFALTLRDEGIHIIEHLTFLGTALVTWWPVLSPAVVLPPLRYPLRMVYLFLQTLPCSLVGALITLKGHVLYTPYDLAPRLWGLSTLQDQQVGGLLMWIGGSLYFFLAFTLIFFRWFAYEEHISGGGLHLVNKGA